MNGEFRALSLGSLVVILVALGVWAAFFGPDDAGEFANGTADGPLVRHGLPYSGDGEAAEISGLLELRDGCLVVAYEPDGADTQLPLVWPAKTEWDATAAEVVLANGDRIALGESVWGGGGYRRVGRIDFVDDSAQQLLRDCALNSWAEVAVFNNTADAARPG